MIELSGPQIALRVFMRGKMTESERRWATEVRKIQDYKPRIAGSSGICRSQEQSLLGGFQKEPAMLVP